MEVVGFMGLLWRSGQGVGRDRGGQSKGERERRGREDGSPFFPFVLGVQKSSKDKNWELYISL